MRRFVFDAHIMRDGEKITFTTPDLCMEEDPAMSDINEHLRKYHSGNAMIISCKEAIPGKKSYMAYHHGGWYWSGSEIYMIRQEGGWKVERSV